MSENIFINKNDIKRYILIWRMCIIIMENVFYQSCFVYILFEVVTINIVNEIRNKMYQ